MRGSGWPPCRPANSTGFAAGQGWRWRVQPVPATIAVRADDLAGFGVGPVTAIVLALGVDVDGGRPLEVAVERAVRDGDSLRIDAALPAGYVGAPVFGVRPTTSGRSACAASAWSCPAGTTTILDPATRWPPSTARSLSSRPLIRSLLLPGPCPPQRCPPPLSEAP